MDTIASAVAREDGGLGARDVHDIVLAKGSRLVADSEGLGWRNVYAAITSERRWSGTLQPIEHVCIAYCLRRAATIERRIDGEDRSTVSILRPRHFGFVPTRTRSTFRLTGDADIMMLYFSGALVERTAQRLFGLSAAGFELQPRIGVLDPLLEQLALEIAAALHRRAAADALYTDELATLAAAHLLRHHCDRRSPQQPSFRATPSRYTVGAGLERVRDFIEERLDSDLGLPVLAKEAGLRPSVFAKAFGEAFGATPHQYVIRRRLERSKALLIGTDLPLSEVALLTGFASQSHFSEVFKRNTGETPRGYRHTSASADG